MAKIIVELGNRSPVEVSLTEGVYTVGRATESSIQIDHRSIAERHCQLEVLADGRMMAEDCRSATGTFLNGERIERAVIKTDDVLAIGGATIRRAAAQKPAIAPVAVQEAPSFAEGRATFLREIPGAFRYSLQGELMLLILIIILIDQLPGILPGLLKYAGILLGLLFGGVLFAFWKDIVASTSQGGDDFGFHLKTPDWEEQRENLLKYVGLVLACFGPLMISRYFATASWIKVSLFLIGATAFPMGFLVFALTDTFGGLHPVFLIKSALRAPFDYAITVGLFVVLICGMIQPLGFEASAPRALQMIVSLVKEAVGLYCAFTWMRILGLYYRCNEERLAWD